MKGTNIIPQACIAAYVDRILVIENNEVANPFSLPLYANGQPTLLFTSIKGSIQQKDRSYLTLFGQTVLPETLTLNDHFTLIAYFFKPYALLHLFDIAAPEITDKPIDLYVSNPQKTNELQEQLLNEIDLATRLRLLDQYILTLMNRSKNLHDKIVYASNFIAANPVKESLVKLQSDLHVTERTFQRMFEKHIGIAPNLYRRICQFNNAFQQLNLGQFSKLSDLAFNNGYADQSHYIRAFKEFTSITPGDYINFPASS